MVPLGFLEELPSCVKPCEVPTVFALDGQRPNRLRDRSSVNGVLRTPDAVSAPADRSRPSGLLGVSERLGELDAPDVLVLLDRLDGPSSPYGRLNSETRCPSQYASRYVSTRI